MSKTPQELITTMAANRQKALALAAMVKGVAVYAQDENGLLTGLWMVDLYTFHFVCEREGVPKQSRRAVAGKAFATPIQAYVAAAEALGLEPDPILQHQERTRPALSDSQRESLLIVAEVAGDLAVNAEAVELGARSAPSAAELLAWAEELQRPARLLETLFDLAPKESTPEPSSSVLPTPADLHRTIGQARGLIQTAIGQMRDLGIPHVSKHLCSARRYLDGGKAHIESALLTVIPDPQEGGKPDA